MMSKNLSIRLNVNGVLVDAVTITGLGRIVGKSRNTLLRYERIGVFPPAPLVVGTYRYYPISLVKSLAPIVEELPLNTKPSAEVLAKINLVFKQEVQKYAKK